MLSHRVRYARVNFALGRYRVWCMDCDDETHADTVAQVQDRASAHIKASRERQITSLSANSDGRYLFDRGWKN